MLACEAWWKGVSWRLGGRNFLVEGVSFWLELEVEARWLVETGSRWKAPPGEQEAPSTIGAKIITHNF